MTTPLVQLESPPRLSSASSTAPDPKTGAALHSHDADPIAPVTHRDGSDGVNNDAPTVPSLQTFTPGLTEKQHALYLFIAKFTREKGFSPSFDEMAAAMDLKSKSSIHRLIEGLELRGYVRRLGYKARSVEIIEREESSLRSAAAQMLGVLERLQPKIKGDSPFKTLLAERIARWRDVVMT